MRPFKFLVIALTLMGALLAAGPAHAAITVLNYWRMGENDPGAASGGQCTNTLDGVSGNSLTNTSVGGLYPTYTNGVSVAASAETGSTLALALTNGQYGTAALATDLADNFGIECWVQPGTTASGGQILAYNGLRGNGWGLYQDGTQFEVLYGGFIFWGSAVATAGTWTHLALVRNGGVATLYTNGVPASTNSATPTAPSGTFTMGGDAQFGEYFTGAIDEVRVFTFAAGAFSTNDLLLNSNNVLLVSNPNDSGAGSLRAAVASAPNGAAITFAPGLSGQTITLTNGELGLNQNLTIDASALTNGLTLSGGNASRIFQVGGGVTVVLNTLTITNGNDTGPNAGGGGILNFGTLTLNNCTLAGNSANQAIWGGGAILSYSATLTLNQCTLSGNSANNSTSGGGIHFFGGSLTLNQSTVSGNSASGSDGGIRAENGGTLTLTNSIVAGNIGGDVFGSFSGGDNLASGSPLLAPLGNYGGPTPTMPPMAGSPAIDGCTDGTAFASDQRGFPRIVGPFADIGAVEYESGPVVTTNLDGGVGSLRYVLAYTTNGSAITFTPGLSGQTITLTNGELVLNQNVTIDASALASPVQINGNGLSRVFQVDGSVTAELNDLIITNGTDNGGGVQGGGVLNNGSLTLNNCTIAGNQANNSDGGGGIAAQNGVLTVNDCTFTGNQANNSFFGGGGICVGGDGGGGTVNVNNCTISGNQAGDGGGIDIDSGLLNLTNSIVCSNSPNNIDAPIHSGANNLTDTNALLAVLGGYGGPTQTMPPLPGSPAINAGAPTALTTDQRGFPRPPGLSVDIGAVQLQTPSLVVTASADSGAGSLRQLISQVDVSSTITFATNLSGQTIGLTGGEIAVGNNLIIDGSALANGVVLSGSNVSRIFNIGGSGNLTLNSLTLQDANGGGGDGGAILNVGNTTLNACTLTANSTGSGGAIVSNQPGSMALNNCTLTGNSSAPEGGGGAIVNRSLLAINNCTLYNNTSFNGGAIYNDTTGTLDLTNSIAAGPSTPNIFQLGAVNGSFNLVDTANVNLAPLGNYGGPTPTLPPLPGSPAIDAGSDTVTNFLATDQRGPGFPRLLGAQVDIGAVEGVYNPAGPGTLKEVAKLRNGSVQFGFTNYSGMTYTVLAGTNVAAPLTTWLNLGPAVESPPGTFLFTDPQATNYPQRFYQVQGP